MVTENKKRLLDGIKSLKEGLSFGYCGLHLLACNNKLSEINSILLDHLNDSNNRINCVAVVNGLDSDIDFVASQMSDMQEKQYDDWCTLIKGNDVNITRVIKCGSLFEVAQEAMRSNADTVVVDGSFKASDIDYLIDLTIAGMKVVLIERAISIETAVKLYQLESKNFLKVLNSAAQLSSMGSSKLKEIVNFNINSINKDAIDKMSRSDVSQLISEIFEIPMSIISTK